MLSLRPLLLSLSVLAATAVPAAGSSIGVYTQTLWTQQLGYVPELGALNWSHTFQPLADRFVLSVESVVLSIRLADDTICQYSGQCLTDRLWTREHARIWVSGEAWRQVVATATVVQGEIGSMAALLDHDGILDVSAQSLLGDFDVVSSSLTVTYRYLSQIPRIEQPRPEQPGPAVPEPHGVVLFATALALVGPRLRGQHARRRLPAREVGWGSAA